MDALITPSDSIDRARARMAGDGLADFTRLLEVIGRKPDEIIAICHARTGHKGSLPFRMTTVAEAPAVAQGWAGQENLWFSIQPMTAMPKGGQYSRGTAEDVTWVCCLAGDLDQADSHAAGAGGGMTPEVIDAIIEGVSAVLGSRPVAVVSTGHGKHPYWALSTPLSAAEGAKLLARFRIHVLQVAATYGVVPARKGLPPEQMTIDSTVYDLPRVLRIPGPPNLKWSAPVDTSVVFPDGAAALDPQAVHDALDANLRPESVADYSAAEYVKRADDAPREFTRADADAYIDKHILERVRSTPWDCGDAFRHKLYGAARSLWAFLDMFAQEDLEARLRQAIRDGHDNDEPDADDNAHIRRGFAAGDDWRAVEITEEQQRDRRREYRADPANAERMAERDRAEMIAFGVDPDAPVGQAGSSGKSAGGASTRGERVAARIAEQRSHGYWLPEEFWAIPELPGLAHLRQAAQSRAVSAEVVVASALALTVAHVEPNIVIPAWVASVASLNLGAVVHAGSGDSKSAGVDVAREVCDFGEAEAMHMFNPSTAQGIAGQYQRLAKVGGVQTLIPSRRRAVADVDEGDTLAALGVSQQLGLIAELRKAIMGKLLGFGNVGETKTNLPAHSYRMAMILCTLTKNADWIVGDTVGGLPGRLVWACATDSRVIRGVEWPGPLRINLPETAKADPFADNGAFRGRFVLTADSEVEREVIQDSIDRKELGGDEIDGHAVLVREKVGWALALMHGRTHMRYDVEWRAAGMFMASSIAARQMVIDAAMIEAAGEQERSNQSKGRGAVIARKAEAITEAEEIAGLAQEIIRLAKEACPDGGKTWGHFERDSRILRNAPKEWVQRAIQVAADDDAVDLDETRVHKGKPVLRIVATDCT